MNLLLLIIRGEISCGRGVFFLVLMQWCQKYAFTLEKFQSFDI